MKSANHDLLEAAYLFYYATDAASASPSNLNKTLHGRLAQLLGDMLIIANNVSNTLHRRAAIPTMGTLRPSLTL